MTPMKSDMEACAYCGEERSLDQFEDGLRCKFCAEAADMFPDILPERLVHNDIAERERQKAWKDDQRAS